MYSFGVRLICFLLTILVAGRQQLLGGTIRDDVPDSQYLNLAAQSQYAPVGKLTTLLGLRGSGTLIASNWVLTAAHVTIPDSGIFYIDKFTVQGSAYSVDYWVSYPGYDPATQYFDVALVHLSTPVTGITPAARHAGQSEVGAIGTIVGFGSTGTGLTGEQDGTDGTKRAGQNMIDVLWPGGSSDSALGIDFDNPHNPADSKLGLPTPLPLEYCPAHGDSGGGLFITVGGQQQLAGITSGSPDAVFNASYGSQTAFRRVSAFNDWIDDNTAQSWRNANGGSIGSTSNWGDGVIPGGGDIALFHLPTTYTVQLDGPRTVGRLLFRRGQVTLDLQGHIYQVTSTSMNGSVLVGRSSSDNASLVISNGAIASVDGMIATSPGVVGQVLVSSGASWSLSDSLYVGGSNTDNGGNGTLTLEAGGTLNVSRVLKIWTSGTMNFNGGTLTASRIDNLGIFRKSSGTGTALVFTNFNNAGTVEVDSGTLTINGGSSNAAHYEFGNGGRVNASLTWQGANTANGNGVLAVGGSVAAGTTATFASSGFTNGAQLEVGVGGGSDLNVGAGATLTLNMTGSQQAKMVGGNLHGAGTTINLGNFAWSGGNIGDAGTGAVVNQGIFVWTGGAVTGSGGLTNQGSLTIHGDGGHGPYNYAGQNIWGGGALTNGGTISHAADGVLGMGPGATLNNLAGAVYDWQGDGQIGGYYTGYYFTNGGTIANAGLFCKSAGTGTSSIPYAPFNNTGTVEVQSGTLTFGTFNQPAGSTDLNGGKLAFSSGAQMQGGQLVGSGTVNGSVANSGGLLSPGHSLGAIFVNGSYAQGPSGSLLIELAGLGSGQFDYLNVIGTASLDGILEVEFLNGYHPTLGDSFDIMSFGSRAGSFREIDVLGQPGYMFAPQYTAHDLILVTQSVPEPLSLTLGLTAVVCLLAMARKRGRNKAARRSPRCGRILAQ